MFQLKFSKSFFLEWLKEHFKKKSGLTTTHRVEPVQGLQAWKKHQIHELVSATEQKNAHIWEKINLDTHVFMLLCSIIKPKNHDNFNQMITANLDMASLKGNPVGNTSLTEKD